MWVPTAHGDNPPAILFSRGDVSRCFSNMKLANSTEGTRRKILLIEIWHVMSRTETRGDRHWRQKIAFARARTRVFSRRIFSDEDREVVPKLEIMAAKLDATFVTIVFKDVHLFIFRIIRKKQNFTKQHTCVINKSVLIRSTVELYPLKFEFAS